MQIHHRSGREMGSFRNSYRNLKKTKTWAVFPMTTCLSICHLGTLLTTFEVDVKRLVEPAAAEPLHVPKTASPLSKGPGKVGRTKSTCNLSWE